MTTIPKRMIYGWCIFNFKLSKIHVELSAKFITEMENLDWELHKPEIERLYLGEGKTLKELSQFMERKYGFRKT